MELAARRSMRSVAALTTVGALALTPIAIAPPELHAPSIAATRIATEAVQLTDAWYDLLNNTLNNVGVLGQLFLGGNNTWPLPNPTIPLAPIATQLVLNPLIYTVQLLTGQGADIPAEISTHVSQVLGVIQLVVTQVPPIIFQQIQAPFFAIQQALESIANSANLLLGLIEAPAVLLDYAINSQYGLLGGTGPVAVGIIVRNLFAKALETPLPTVVLPFKKAGGAAATSKTLTPKATTVTAPSGTANSARSKPKTPSSASTSAKKAGTAKAGSARNGVGRGKR
ncbi:hypothetical protein FHT44_002589 [Mycolicibacterium sp. BK634]|uniref:hypothetical protein n=1 Tax=Mycolicibacterium sp. BK634 TaxID=2587099 RepID=UPI00160787F2|nr:hypothetical protein [Mycolicibacterium sp. BK634]MBB3750128.1 hypothetical protein [Mycolicibacterium sp. BK634]